MNWDIKYPAKLKATAKAQDLDLIAIGTDTWEARVEITKAVPRGMGSALFCFAHFVISGDSPADAFAKIAWPGEMDTKSTEQVVTEGQS